MKHKQFFLICLALMALLFTVAGALALAGYPRVSVGFWDASAIESRAGKAVWTTLSALCCALLVALLIRERRDGR